MEKAIKRAIEGGYKEGCATMCNSDYLLDPLFWQALGKAEGWDNGVDEKSVGAITYVPPAWRREWYHFIDHLADGGTLDDFFNSLLK